MVILKVYFNIIFSYNKDIPIRRMRRWKVTEDGIYYICKKQVNCSLAFCMFKITVLMLNGSRYKGKHTIWGVYLYRIKYINKID